MAERPRPHKPVVVSLDVVWADSSGRFDARMSEISREGCFIESKVGGGLGDTIAFKVHLPGGPWVSLQGELTSAEYPIGFALRFTDLTDATRRLLAEVVAAHGGAPLLPSIAEREERPAASAPRRVLVADDDRVTLRLLETIVAKEGYEVVAVEDGREAFRILQRDADFSAAIFDMNMPHLHGLDLIVYMKGDERLRAIPVGMITADQDPKVWDDSLAAGARIFLPKPFNPPQVQMMLRMLMRT